MKKEKELMKFIESLYNRGLLSKSLEEFDYEWVIFDYIKKLNKPLVIKSVCSLCRKEIEVSRESNIFCDECWEKL